jgi:hypothetical protein
MSSRQVAWFLAAYVALVAAAVWFNVAVLCLGDAKYEQGCGGFGVYLQLWEIFLAPLPIAAILLERWRKSESLSAAHLLLYLAGILIVLELGWLVIEKFPALLATEAVAIGMMWLVRVRTVRRVARRPAA